MAKITVSRRVRTSMSVAAQIRNERTSNRIRAYLDSVHAVSPELEELLERAEGIVERLAGSAHGPDDRPTIRLSPQDAAEVLRLIACTRPQHPATWFDDPVGAPSPNAGFVEVLQAVIESVDAPPSSVREAG